MKEAHGILREINKDIFYDIPEKQISKFDEPNLSQGIKKNLFF